MAVEFNSGGTVACPHVGNKINYMHMYVRLQNRNTCINTRYAAVESALSNTCRSSYPAMLARRMMTGKEIHFVVRNLMKSCTTIES